MIVDSHQHFWDLEQVQYEWIIPDYGPIYRNFEPEDLRPLIDEAGVDATVAVQAANSLEETDALLARAASSPFVAAVVGWVPLEQPQQAALALDERYSSSPSLKGIRHLNHDEPDPDWLVRTDVLDGLGVLAARNLVFEIVAAYPLHLPHIPAIASAHPDLTIIVDHLGKPPIASGDLEGWKEQLSAVAGVDGVVAKVSGLNTLADWANWGADDLVEPIGHAVEEFSADRLMFGSDWPVAVLAGSYQKVWEETQRALDLVGLLGKERDALLGATAARIYGLETE